jgi:hypothetical protein
MKPSQVGRQPFADFWRLNDPRKCLKKIPDLRTMGLTNQVLVVQDKRLMNQFDDGYQLKMKEKHEYFNG